jgi:plastocyanin
MNRILIALRRGALVTLTLVLASVLAACAGGNGDGSPAGGGGTATVENGAVEIVSEELEFDVGTIEAPAGEAFTITLVNNAETQPHNITIYTEQGGDVIGEVGATAEAGQTVETEVPALEPGTYYFQCDIHPEMNGSVVVEG